MIIILFLKDLAKLLSPIDYLPTFLSDFIDIDLRNEEHRLFLDINYLIKVNSKVSKIKVFSTPE